MSEITSWTATETVERLRGREVSASEVTQAHIARMEALNPALNAIVQRVDEAMARAKAIDAGDVDGGVLHGAPVTLKVNVDLEGYPNTNGLPVFESNTSPADSAVAANLSEAGAVVIGRTNTPEMSMRWFTSNPLHGTSLNPWNEAMTPGGSSGAAAAAVASGIGVIAHGNDLGGSLRYPAFCCGVASIRPSMGRVPAFNPSAPPSRPPITTAMSVQGPIARTVADVRLGLDAMRGRSSADPLWTSAPDSGRARDGKLTIGIAAHPFETPTHPSLLRAMELAVKGLREAGHNAEEVRLPETEHAMRLWGELLMTETELYSGDFVREHGSEDFNGWLKSFVSHFEAPLDLRGYITGQMERLRLQRLYSQVFDRVDAVVMPTSLMPPFENDLDFKAPARSAEIINAQKPLCLVNLLGLPAVALPTHVENGLPLGVQIIGAMHDDDFVLDVAESLEAEIGTVLAQMPEPFRL